eukprot:COSAG06_NODE_8465_length_2165_cov_1.278316_1_plen_91_part_00
MTPTLVQSIGSFTYGLVLYIWSSGSGGEVLMLVQNMAVTVAHLDAKTDVLAAQMEDLTNTSAADYGCNMTTTSSCNVTLQSIQAAALTVG